LPKEALTKFPPKQLNLTLLHYGIRLAIDSTFLKPKLMKHTIIAR